MKIVEIKGPDDQSGLNSFLGVAKEVYANDPVWVPESEQAFLKLYRIPGKVSIRAVVAFEDDKPAARAAAIFNPQAADAEGNPQGWIGFFESVEGHQEAGEEALKRCESILKEAGAKSVLAPKVDNLLVGLLTGGFNLPQTVLSNHNPPYYLGLFQKCGYQLISKMRAFSLTRETPARSKIALPGFITREFDRKYLPREIAIFNKLQYSIFGGLNSYVSRTEQEDLEMVQSFLPFLDDELVIIAEDLKGNAAGLLICLPDVYQALKGHPIDRARIISIGVIPGWSQKGLGAMMGAHLMRNLVKKGYKAVEASWILADNLPSQNLAKRFSAASSKEYALLGKRL